MSGRPTFAIVGANVAGGRAAETLRGQGFDGRIVLIGAEPDRPYECPPLSKERLRREKRAVVAFVDGGATIGRLTASLGAAHVVAVPKAVARQRMDHDPSLTNALAQCCAQRARALAKRLEMRTTCSTVERDARALLPYAPPDVLRSRYRGRPSRCSHEPSCSVRTGAGR